MAQKQFAAWLALLCLPMRQRKQVVPLSSIAAGFVSNKSFLASPRLQASHSIPLGLFFEHVRVHTSGCD